MNDERRPARRPRQHDQYADSTARPRTAPALELYARAARLELLAALYERAGQHRRHDLGVDIAARLETLADLKAAA